MRPVYKATSVRPTQDNPNEQKQKNTSKPRVPIYIKTRRISKNANKRSKSLSYCTEMEFNKRKREGKYQNKGN